MDNNVIFNTFANSFKRKMEKDLCIQLQFEVYDTDYEKLDIWQVDVKNSNISLYNGEKIIPERVYGLSKNTLIKLFENRISPPTAFAENPSGKGNWDINPNIQENPMNSLIGVKFRTKEEKSNFLKTINTKEWDDLNNRVKKFSTFFSKEYPTKIAVTQNNGIKIHNDINGISLYSSINEGKYRFHVYFSIQKDEILEEPAFKFNIYVISGKGMIETGEEKYEIEEKNYYYFNPVEKFYIKNKEDCLLEILLFKL
jgi:hypothetical protein